MARDFKSGLQVSGGSGYMKLTAISDGGEFNIGTNNTGNLALFGEGANVLHLNILDGDLKTNGTVRLSNAGTLQNTRINPRVNSTTSSATPAINTDTTDQFNITALGANITSMTSGLTGTPVDGQKLLIRIKGAAAQTITWGTSFSSSGVATLLATTVAGKTHLIGLIYDSVAAKWICQAVDATGY